MSRKKREQASDIASRYVPPAFNSLGISERQGWIQRASAKIEKMRSDGKSDDAIVAKLFHDEDAAKRESRRFWRKLPSVSWKKILIPVGAIAAVLGVAVGGVTVYGLQNMPDSINAIPTRGQSGDKADDPTDTDSRNIVMTGVDRRSDNKFGEGNSDDVPGSRTDTIMLVNISGDGSSISGVSIPRDSAVKLDSCRNYDVTSGKYAEGNSSFDGRINAAYGQGGPECTVKAVEKLTGVQADSYIEADFNAFSDAVDAIGGVNVCTSGEMVDDELGTIIPNAGNHHLNGEQALNYARARKVEGTGKSDFDRIQRQQSIIASVFSKVKGNGTLSDINQLRKLIPTIGNNLRTDGLSIPDMVNLAFSVSRADYSAVSFRTAPTVGENEDGSLIVDVPSLKSIVSSFGKAVDQKGDSRASGVAMRSKTDVTIRTRLSGDPRAQALGRMLEKAGFSSVSISVVPGEVPDKTSVVWSTGNEKSAGALVQALPNSYVRRAKTPDDYSAVIELGQTRAGSVSPANSGMKVSLPLDWGETRKNSDAVEKFSGDDAGAIIAKQNDCSVK